MFPPSGWPKYFSTAWTSMIAFATVSSYWSFVVLTGFYLMVGWTEA
jgi:hypothetical protein